VYLGANTRASTFNLAGVRDCLQSLVCLGASTRAVTFNLAGVREYIQFLIYFLGLDHLPFMTVTDRPSI